VSTLDVVERRSYYLFRELPPKTKGAVYSGDSRFHHRSCTIYTFSVGNHITTLSGHEIVQVRSMAAELVLGRTANCGLRTRRPTI
jgi:hypothetical protein